MADKQESPRPVNEEQPAPAADRQDPAHPPESTVRKGYEDAQGPESQGDGDPGPDRGPPRSSSKDNG